MPRQRRRSSRRASDDRCHDPQGRAARPSRGHGRPGPDQPHRAAQLHAAAGGDARRASTSSTGRTSCTSSRPTISPRASSARSEDYRDVTFEYLAGCAQEGAVYVELIASPDHANAVGLSDEEHFDAIAQGIDDARERFGIEARIIATCLRNRGVEGAEEVARRVVRTGHPYVVGFNMAGDEAGFPPEPFAPRLRDRRRRRAGLHRARGRARRGPVRPRRDGPAGHHAGVPRRSRDRGPVGSSRSWPSAGSSWRSAPARTWRSASTRRSRSIHSLRFMQRACASR